MFYRLRRTFVAVPVSSEAVLFRSDTRSFRIDGAFASLLATRVLELVDGRTPVDEIAGRLGVPVAEFRQNLDALVGAGVLESSPSPLEDVAMDPRLNLIEALASSSVEAATRLAAARLVLFGLEGLGELVAEQLAAAGFRNLLLVDSGGPGRDAAVATRLRQRFPDVSSSAAGVDHLDRGRALQLARDKDLLIACWDRGFEAANHWVNRAAIELNVPAVFGAVGGLQAFAGPFVVPGMTACYMCSRMRAVAVSENYEEAMASEHFFDQLKSPGLAHREFFPTSLGILAGLLVTDVYKYVVLQYQPTLLGQIIEFDPLTLGLERHALLEQPQCPVCSKKKTTHVVIPAWRSSSVGETPARGRSSP